MAVHLHDTGRQHDSWIFVFNSYIWLSDLCHAQDKMCVILFPCLQEEVTALLVLHANMCAYVHVHACAFVCVYIFPRSCHLLYFHTCFLDKPKHSSATKLDTEHDVVAAFIGRERVIKRKIRTCSKPSSAWWGCKYPWQRNKSIDFDLCSYLPQMYYAASSRAETCCLAEAIISSATWGCLYLMSAEKEGITTKDETKRQSKIQCSNHL